MFRTRAGRFLRGRVQVIPAVEARLGDEASAIHLDLKLEDWASAELKSIAVDYYQQRHSVESCLGQQRG